MASLFSLTSQIHRSLGAMKSGKDQRESLIYIPPFIDEKQALWESGSLKITPVVSDRLRTHLGLRALGFLTLFTILWYPVGAPFFQEKVALQWKATLLKNVYIHYSFGEKKCLAYFIAENLKLIV